MGAPAKQIQDNDPYAGFTPMMQQYMRIKEAHADCLLFYRMGDFYELFFDDAKTAAEVLDIALTHRGKHMEQDIPMCGVPWHSHESYLNKLIKSGYKVAVCEQLESPEEAKKRGHKAVVERDVVRIITPGTLTEDSLLESSQHNFLAAIARHKKSFALAWVDISTGDFKVTELQAAQLSAELSRIQPSEILLPDALLSHAEFATLEHDWGRALVPHVEHFFSADKGKRKLQDHYAMTSLDALGFKQDAEFGACGALLEYISLTQKGQMPQLDYPAHVIGANVMGIDAATRANLELNATSAGERKGSVFGVINRTKTSVGARLLQSYLNAPLTEPKAINARLDLVSCFIGENNLRDDLRDILSELPDMERAFARLSMGRGGPRDMAAIRQGLHAVLRTSELLEIEYKQIKAPKLLKEITKQLGEHDALRNELNAALNDEVGVLMRDGGFIRDGYDPKLDDYRHTFKDSQTLRAALRDRYAKETSIDKLKIKENNVIGLFIEVTPQYQDKMGNEFIHRQTMANAVRYTTSELRELEHKIVNAKGYALALEHELFEKLRVMIIAQRDAITSAARAMAQLDVFTSLAVLAQSRDYCRPEMDSSDAFKVTAGRHVVVEALSDDAFIPNNCNLSGDSEASRKLWLMTGPNMAGKSTFLRQNALIAILAQMGSYVPAQAAHVGIVDRVFSRVGAADDLARGRSTFMVEMVETATILHQATDKSLVILDEIGRGTATFDGLSIAWAVVEYLHHKNKSRALFATHYHELTALTRELDQLCCATMKVKEWNDDIVFLHEVVSGAADRSYGVHVGKLAGLPRTVVSRAQEILSLLQEGEEGASAKAVLADLPLFSLQEEADGYTSSAQYTSPLQEALDALDVDSLSPREALDKLYELKEML